MNPPSCIHWKRTWWCWSFTAVALVLFLVQNDISSFQLRLQPTRPENLESTTAFVPSAYFINRTKSPSETTVKTLLLTYGRSGSSLLGELLAAYPDTAYYYEPIHLITLKNVVCDEEIEKSLEILDALFNCDIIHVRQRYRHTNLQRRWWLSAMKIPQQEKVCRTRKAQSNSQSPEKPKHNLIKTIRIGITPRIKEWLLGRDYKIVHLLRDPRAVANSRRKHADFKSSVDSMCSQMIVNFYELQNFPKDRYWTVRYEDLVQDPVRELTILFNFLQLPMKKTLIEKAIGHKIADKQKASVKDIQVSTQYYSTLRFRDSLNPFKWKSEIPQELRTQTELKCSKIIEAFGYKEIPCDGHD